MTAQHRCSAVILVVVASLLCSSCDARITNAKISGDDRRIIAITEAFGFGSEGFIDISIKNFKIYHPPGPNVPDPDPSRVGFFITTSESEAQLQLELDASKTCILDAENVVELFTFEGKGKSFNYKVALSEIIPDYSGGVFSLLFANCEKDTLVTYDVRASLYNVRGKGRKDYLSVGEDVLPSLYMTMFVLFTCAAAVWVAMLLRARPSTHKIHVMMAVLVSFKALTLLSQAGMYHLIRSRGHADGWNIAFYVFTFLRGVLFFSVVVLVGTGWSYMKPLLADKEKRILAVVIPLQVFAEVAIIIIDENTPAQKSWFTWRDMLHLVDIVCCCAILFPIVWSIKHLREASQTDGKAARSLAKLQLFRQFYVMVVAYIYFTRIVVYLLRSTMPYRYVWLSEAASELATLAFYATTGYKFRPHAENPYFSLAMEDREEQEGVQMI